MPSIPGTGGVVTQDLQVSFSLTFRPEPQVSDALKAAGLYQEWVRVEGSLDGRREVKEYRHCD